MFSVLNATINKIGYLGNWFLAFALCVLSVVTPLLTLVNLIFSHFILLHEATIAVKVLTNITTWIAHFVILGV